MTAWAEGISVGGLPFEEATRHAQRCLDALTKSVGWSAIITGFSARPELFVFEAELLDAEMSETAKVVVRVHPEAGAVLQFSASEGMAVRT